MLISVAVAAVVSDWAGAGIRTLKFDEGFTLHTAMIAFDHAVVAFVSSAVLKALLPFLAMAQRALALSAFGVEWATLEAGSFHNLLNMLVERDNGESDEVRIICISGHTLFGEKAHEKGFPLKQWAENGKLNVLMPTSSAENPTVAARWRSYSKSTKQAYGTVDGLVSEIEKSKQALRNDDNKITEHNIIIVWRLVIFQKFCLVQRYLPNPSGSASDDAPTFIYSNSGKNSFYRTYLEMFKEIQRTLDENAVGKPPVT